MGTGTRDALAVADAALELPIAGDMKRRSSMLYRWPALRFVSVYEVSLCASESASAALSGMFVQPNGDDAGHCAVVTLERTWYVAVPTVTADWPVHVRSIAPAVVVADVARNPTGTATLDALPTTVAAADDPRMPST